MRVVMWHGGIFTFIEMRRIIDKVFVERRMCFVAWKERVCECIDAGVFYKQRGTPPNSVL